MILACEDCKFVFDIPLRICRCPDCGHVHVRHATAEEIMEYKGYRREYGPAYPISFSPEDILISGSVVA